MENDAENDEEIKKLLDGLDGDPKKVEVGPDTCRSPRHRIPFLERK